VDFVVVNTMKKTNTTEIVIIVY